MMLAVIVGGLIDFLVTYATNIALFLVVHLLFVRGLDVKTRYHRVHPYAFVLSLITVVYIGAQAISKYRGH